MKRKRGVRTAIVLVRPHGNERRLKPRLLRAEEAEEVLRRAEGLAMIPLSTREASDLIMLGIGAFTPLAGFMGHDDWRGVCAELATAEGLFWPIPITLSTDGTTAASLDVGQEVALVDGETGELMATLTIAEKYRPDKTWQCQQVFGTADASHPGVASVLAEREVNLGGSVCVVSEGEYPRKYPGLCLRPDETRELFAAKGWDEVAALQLRNPIHRSHEYLAKLAIELGMGLLIHQKLGKLKPGDIPAEVRVRAVDALVRKYFVPETCIQAGVPVEMRYAGPREALFDAVFRQNFGCSHLLIGRDHAGVGTFYGPFDAHRIFDELPAGSLEIRPLRVDITFYCYSCDGMATGRTCPHPQTERLQVSGTTLRKLLSEGGVVPEHYSRPEVLEILREYYASLEKEGSAERRRYA